MVYCVDEKKGGFILVRLGTPKDTEGIKRSSPVTSRFL